MSCAKIKAKLKKKGIIADITYSRDLIYGGYYFDFEDDVIERMCEASDDWEMHEYWDYLDLALEWVDTLPDLNKKQV